MKTAYAPPARALKVGQPVSSFVLEKLDGRPVPLLHLQGPHGTLLIFFSTRCACSRKAVSREKAFVEASRSRGIKVYGVAIHESREAVKRFIGDQGLNYPVLIDVGGRVADEYGITETPTLVGVNAGGVVRYLDHRLPADAESLVRLLTSPAAALPPHGDASSTAVLPRANAIARDDLLTLIETDKQLTIVDVLKPKDYQRAHIQGAISIPLPQIDSLHGRLDKVGTIITYGAGFTSPASTQAAERLMALGFRGVRDYKGGIEEWSKAGLPIEQGDPVCFITRDELVSLRRNRPSLVLVDVLSPESFAKEHIAGAINIPLKDLDRGAAALDKGATIVVYCSSYTCRASTTAALRLTALGFKAVHDYKGGLHEWKESNLPTEGAEVNSPDSFPGSAAGGEVSSRDAEDQTDIDCCCT